jgi:prophage maintenance system killer protein
VTVRRRPGAPPAAVLTESDLIALNKRILAETAFEGDRPHAVQNRHGLRRTLRILEDSSDKEPIERATLLCCALIGHHCFDDANHRTSLEAPLLLLLFHGYDYSGSVEDEKALYNWRYDYEEAHSLESEWCHILGGWDNEQEARQYVHRLASSPYGAEIAAFLRKHSHRIEGGSEFFATILPSPAFEYWLSRYPSKPFRKALRRIRRAARSRMRKTWSKQLELSRKVRKQLSRRKPQKPWRPDS